MRGLAVQNELNETDSLSSIEIEEKERPVNHEETQISSEVDAEAESSSVKTETIIPVADSVPVSSSYPTYSGLGADNTMTGNPPDISTDSIEAAREPVYGIILTPPPDIETPPRHESESGTSFIILALFVVFFAICFRFHNNGKFLSALKRSLFEVKERSNLFDDTVRETSFLLMLNVMWCACTGVILYRLIEVISPTPPLLAEGAGMGVCMAAALLYSCFMALACITVGNVFSDSLHSRLWLKGFGASQGIMGFLYFPLSLAILCYPGLNIPLLWMAAGLFISGRSLFIFKGFRIFFTQSSSWVLFLYYLCSLEIVPLILTYAVAVNFCMA